MATANAVDRLPPEMMRKGRFDEIFFVDLPKPAERVQIFKIHLAKRKRDPDKFKLDLLAKKSEGFSGAEIEQAIISALYDAYDSNRDIKNMDIIQALQTSVPLSVTMREDLEHLRAWASERARQASS